MTTLGRYEITGTLGEGAMGVVHRAHDPALDRQIALKELRFPPGLSAKARTEAIDRFYTEARAAARLSHPSIVTIHEVGEEGGRPFIAMELLDGPTLGEVLEEAGALPPAQAEEVLTQVAEALAHAHAQGVVHRDVKPDNCFWLSDGRVKVADFGIARLEEGTRLTQVGTVMGTPGYMAPEQVKGEEVTASADVFAWGALAYECLTGRPSFGEGDPQAVMYRIVNEDPPDLLALAPDTPAHLAQVIVVALAKDPGERWGDAEELIAGLSAPDDAQMMPVRRAAGARPGLPSQPNTAGSGRRILLLVGIVGLVGLVGATALVVAAASGDEGEVVLPSSPTTDEGESGGTISSPLTPEPSPTRLDPLGASATAELSPITLSCTDEVQSYLASNIIDGDMDTGWGAGESSGIGESITIEFGRRVHLTRIGLTPGYMKFGPRRDHSCASVPAFELNRFVRRVLYQFEDGQVVEHRFKAKAMMQFTDVDVETSYVTISILETRLPLAADDDTVISEAVFEGYYP